MFTKTTKAEKEKNSKKFSKLRLFRRSLNFQTKEYFSNSTLHGVRYIAETERPFGEKFMWFCFTVIGAIAALIIIVSLWEKFQTNPTITGLDTDFHNQQVIFPTVSVCPLEPFDSNRTWQVAYTLASYETDAAVVIEEILQSLGPLSYANIVETYHKSLNLSNSDKTELNTKSLRSLVFDIVASCDEIFEICKYKDEEVQCCDHFYPVYTEQGFCFSFNSRYYDEAHIEEQSDDFHDLFETDKKWGLYFKPSKTSRIYLHSHIETFGWDFRPQILWHDDLAAEILISMKQTYTTEDAKQLSIVQRKCIFPDEVRLDIYNDEYTFTSCMKECRIKKCIQFCKCIPPFYRPLDSAPYCRIDQFACLAKYISNITNVRDCSNCELSCMNTVYDIEKLSITGTESFRSEETYVNIEYLTWPIIRYKREVLFGWVDLLVSFGGIAGLFLGFSLLSGVEIIYYFTMRACCMLYKNWDELAEIEEKNLLQQQKFYNLSLKPLLTRNDINWVPTIKISSTPNDEDIINKGKAKNFLSTPKKNSASKRKIQAAKDLFKKENNKVMPFNISSQIIGGLNSNKYGGYIP